jgi:hypothetical protein
MILMIQFSGKGSFFSCCIVHGLGSRKKAVGVEEGEGMARRKTRLEGGEGMVQGSWIRIARERRLIQISTPVGIVIG